MGKNISKPREGCSTGPIDGMTTVTVIDKDKCSQPDELGNLFQYAQQFAHIVQNPLRLVDPCGVSSGFERRIQIEPL
ncbi:hypothetical protein RRG08_004740 [Elysia crispata]|uniref:Uncharacterized protein n=1 Tax=Elysia crispata TaxID=231223 RepID=A0AAE1DZW5_9GAST|nr:hypothetical protein RRG08_004740 [Elysia crispata]